MCEILSCFRCQASYFTCMPPFCLISNAFLSYFGRHIVLFRMPVVLFRTPHCLISDACCLISDAFCLISDATLSYFRCVLLREIRQSMPISQNNQILSPEVIRHFACSEIRQFVIEIRHFFPAV